MTNGKESGFCPRNLRCVAAPVAECTCTNRPIIESSVSEVSDVYDTLIDEVRMQYEQGVDVRDMSVETFANLQDVRAENMTRRIRELTQNGGDIEQCMRPHTPRSDSNY